MGCSFNQGNTLRLRFALNASRRQNVGHVQIESICRRKSNRKNKDSTKFRKGENSGNQQFVLFLQSLQRFPPHYKCDL